MSNKDENQQDVEDWINQVYYGNCCSHPDEDQQVINLNSCDKKPVEKDSKKAEK
ncbi:MAG: hypothetical protein NE334_12765 [Lentisphaeraceae bacterium]|nr:hypothetical protein [Lentisphaeraceae bacterium]